MDRLSIVASSPLRIVVYAQVVIEEVRKDEYHKFLQRHKIKEISLSAAFYLFISSSRILKFGLLVSVTCVFRRLQLHYPKV